MLPGLTIDIAVPTYNCGKWLDQFIDSLIAQDFTEWRVVTRDDGSNDNTTLIIARYKAHLGKRISVIENPRSVNLGMVANYEATLKGCTAPLIMLADPDDIWKPRKISTMLKAMIKAQSVHGDETPLLIFSDAEVVDEKLRTLETSFWKWSRMKTSFVHSIPRMLMESPVLSSTMMINRPLLARSLPMAGAAAAPDWWIALVACASGKIIAIDQQTIFYRRHDKNDSLEPLISSNLSPEKKIFIARSKVNFLLDQLSPQSAAFARRFGELIGEDNRLAAEAAAKLPSLDFLSRRSAIIRHNLWFASRTKNIGLFVLC